MRRQQTAHDAEPRLMAEGGKLGGEVQRLRSGVHTSIILELSYLSSRLAGRRQLPRIHHGILHLPAVDDLFVADHGPLDLSVLYLHTPAEDAVGDGAAHDAAARL